MSTLQNLEQMQKITGELVAAKDLDEAKEIMSRLLVLMAEEVTKINDTYTLVNSQLAEIENLRRFIKKEGLMFKYEASRKRGVR
ncbi:hypothetical protein [Bacillus bingmayongensis]|uniref:hypothetical protein n=1 Tax=Bacillus bingmayongensis TaxID=1150157 RepID=UPI001C8DFFA6|nr:hypothetical protein [Bacillus bingmayongensis]MBY0597366.1 hypothetical protein [Bacillus bingmayongensis]